MIYPLYPNNIHCKQIKIHKKNCQNDASKAKISKVCLFIYEL